MSINKFQEKVFRTGCGSAVLYVCAAVFFAGMFYAGCGMGKNGGGDQSDQKVAVSVGDTPLYAGDLQKEISAQRDSEMRQRQQEQMQSGQDATGSPDEYPPLSEAQSQAGVLKAAIEGLATEYLARKNGVKFTAEAMAGVAREQFAAQITQARTQFMQDASKKPKPDFSDKAFDAYLKSHYGMTQKEATANMLKKLNDDLKDDKTRPTVETEMARPLLLKAMEAQMKPSDDDLKASYNTYTFKRILFGTDTSSTVAAQIAKAQADLKSGMPFEQVVDRYSKDTAMKGKKVSDVTFDKGMAELTANAAYAPLKALKVGQVSDVIDEPGGKTIYKLISTRNNAPPDLFKQRAKYADEFTQPKAETKLEQDIKDVLSSDIVKWEAPGYKALFDWDKVHSDFSLGSNNAAQMQKVLDEAKNAVAKNAGFDARAALLAWYEAFDAIWNAPGANKAKLRADRIDVTKAMVQDTPYFSLKMELVDLLAQDKQGPAAVSMLVDAASSNVFYNTEGMRDFQEVNAKVEDLKKDGYLDAAGTAAIQKAQDAFIKQNQEVEQEKAQDKAAQKAAQKEEDALKAQQLAEQAKFKADQAKKAAQAGSTKPGAGGKTPTPPTGPATGSKAPPSPPATTSGGAAASGTTAGAATGGTTGHKP